MDPINHSHTQRMIYDDGTIVRTAFLKNGKYSWLLTLEVLLVFVDFSYIFVHSGIKKPHHSKSKRMNKQKCLKEILIPAFTFKIKKKIPFDFNAM